MPSVYPTGMGWAWNRLSHRIIRPIFYKKSTLKSLLEQILAAVQENAAPAAAEAEKLFKDIFGNRDLDNANLMLDELGEMSEKIGALLAKLEEALAKSPSQEDEANLLKNLRDLLAAGQ